jgi:hypothetical protein
VASGNVFDQLPTTRLERLHDDDARQLLASVAPPSLTEPVLCCLLPSVVTGVERVDLVVA